MEVPHLSKILSLYIWILCKARKNIYKKTDDGLNIFLLPARFSLLVISPHQKRKKKNCTSALRLSFAKSQDNLGWKEPLKTVYSKPLAISRNIFNYIRLFRALSNLTLNVSRDGACTISLSNLFQCLYTLIIKIISNFLSLIK